MRASFILLIISLILLTIGCSEDNNGNIDKEITVNKCENINCDNLGSCKVVNDKATCICNEGYHDEGTNCIKDGEDNPCKDINCGEFGNCEIVSQNAECKCADGYHVESMTCIKDVEDGIPEVIPSTQTPEEIANLLYNNSKEFTFTKISTNIQQANGVGPYYGVDENDKLVFVLHTREKYFGHSNWIFCHEADNQCTVLVDNTDIQSVAGSSVYIDGKIFISVLDKSLDYENAKLLARTVVYYDIKEKKLVKNFLNVKGISGETGPLVLGTDHYLYLAGADWRDENHYASYLRFNPNDFTDYSYHSGYYQGVGSRVDRNRDMAVDDDYVYQIIGDNPYQLIAVNKSTQESNNLATLQSGELRQFYYGVGIIYKTSDGIDKKSWLYNGNIIEIDAPENTNPFDQSPPWPNKAWVVSSWIEFAEGYEKPLLLDNNIMKQYAQDDGKAELYFNITRNRNYNNDGLGEVMSFTARTDTYKQKTKLITKLDDKRIMVVGKDYSGISMINTENDNARYLHSNNISTSSILPFYDYETDKRRVLITGYPSVKTVIYTPDAENSIFSQNNIESLGYLRHLEDKNNPGNENDMHKPLDTLQMNEWLYIIGIQYRSGVSGAIIGINTQNDEMFSMREGVFNNYQPRSMTKLENTIAIATQSVSNPEIEGDVLPETPKVMIFDPKTKTVIKEYKPLKNFNAIGAGKIASIDGRYIIGISNNMGTENHLEYSKVTSVYLYMIDTYTDKIVMEKDIKGIKNLLAITSEGAVSSSFDISVHNGYIYAWFEWSTLIRIDKTGKVEVLGKVPNTGHMAFTEKSIYITSDYDLVKIDIPE